jgi:hypothetical protein
VGNLSEALDTRVHQLIADLSATLGRDYSARVHAHAAQVSQFAGDHATEKLTEDIQQQVHDEHISPTWPTCPMHGTHPLWPHGSHWVCEVDDVPIVAIGRLSDLRNGFPPT